LDVDKAPNTLESCQELCDADAICAAIVWVEVDARCALVADVVLSACEDRVDSDLYVNNRKQRAADTVTVSGTNSRQLNGLYALRDDVWVTDFLSDGSYAYIVLVTKAASDGAAAVVEHCEASDRVWMLGLAGDSLNETAQSATLVRRPGQNHRLVHEVPVGLVLLERLGNESASGQYFSCDNTDTESFNPPVTGWKGLGDLAGNSPKLELSFFTCDISLVKETSNQIGACSRGITWGCEPKGAMYVKGGCGGNFFCNDVPVKCESVGLLQVQCKCEAAVVSGTMMLKVDNPDAFAVHRESHQGLQIGLARTFGRADAADTKLTLQSAANVISVDYTVNTPDWETPEDTAARLDGSYSSDLFRGAEYSSYGFSAGVQAILNTAIAKASGFPIRAMALHPLAHPQKQTPANTCEFKRATRVTGGASSCFNQADFPQFEAVTVPINGTRHPCEENCPALQGVVSARMCHDAVVLAGCSAAFDYTKNHGVFVGRGFEK
jgi:hypothetical protein